MNFRSLWFVCLLLSASLSVVPLAPLRGQPQLQPQEQGAAWWAKLAATINDIKAHKMSVEDAWRTGQLSPETTVAALSSWQIVDAGIAMPSGDMQLVSTLCNALAQHAPQILQAPYTMGNRPLIQIANVLARQKDARAVPLYEEVLARKAREKSGHDWDDEVDGTVFNLASYYAQTGQLQKVLDTQKRVFDLSDSTDLQCNWIEQIGWTLDSLGDLKQTKAWYNRLDQSPFARVVVSGRLARAQTLLRAGRAKAARTLMLQPLPPQALKPNAQDPNGLTESRVLTQSLVAQSFLRENDFEGAHSAAVEALNQSALLLPQPTHENYVYATSVARDIETQTEARLAAPFRWNVPSLRFYIRAATAPPTQRVKLHFNTRPHSVITFWSSNPALHLKRLAPIATKAGADYELLVSLAPAKARRSFNASLFARCADFPGHSESLPVSVRVMSPLHAPRPINLP